MTTINSLTTSLYVSQTTISISSSKSTYNDEDQERPAVSGRGEKHGRHHGGGAFMQNVVKTLQSFGLNIPGAGASADESSDNDADAGQNNAANLGQLLQTFLQDLRQVLKQSGVQQPAAEEQSNANAPQTPPKQGTSAATTSVPATTSTAQNATATTATSAQNNAGTQATTTAATTTNTPAPRATVADVRHALHSFLHDLRQALKYSADRRHGSDDDGPGDKMMGRNGYGKFTDNLDNLISALTDTNGSAGSKYKDLQDSFSDLVNLLGSAANGKKPTLLEFLNKLAGNSGENAPATSSAKGAIVFETA
ncbi:hypothetical protein [Methylomonas fluvii]|uniref:Uncharacterized protein n=1 Tax=Methylomonas fluvii TaxID=1854564 RepID=A0ABR9DCI0_9GAMM|nr:hypothetical protein [Methylomonas fluvii]MBD9360797.1 hypothetical protein [Methylomonas fluvii]